jgi:DnaD/phage-associated family protein
MPSANATFVKVYLYGLRLCFANNNEIQNKEIAKKLDILESDVVRAWQYWEQAGIVKLLNKNGSRSHDFDVEFMDLNYSPNTHNIDVKRHAAVDRCPSYSPEEISIYIEQNENIRYMYKYYEQKTGKTLGSTDINILYSLYDWLRLPIEVIIMLIEYCCSINKLSMRYIEKVAITWADLGIDNIETAEKYLTELQSKNTIQNKLRKAFGLNDRSFTQNEVTYIDEWISRLGIDLDLICKAHDLTVMNTGKLSFPYINTILVSWHDRGIKTIAQAEEDIENHKQANKDTYTKKNTNKTSKGNNKFNNFTQRKRDFGELERLAQKNNLNG